MKYTSKCAILSVCSLLVFTECNKQLDLQPQGVLTNQNFYQTEKDFESASRSPYSTLLNLYFDQGGRGWFQTQLYPSDEVVPPNNNSNDQEDFLWNAANGEFSYLWEQCYKGINRANTILEALPKASGFSSEERKARFEGEAKFMRAYFNFILVTNFGNVPIVKQVFTEPEQTRLPNSNPGEAWDLIIEDLGVAKQTLPEKWDANNLGRATNGAATALLGKVYLYRAQWDKNPALYTNAINEFNAVIGKYSLVPFADNFDVNKENNAESVFEIQFSPGGPNAWLPTDFGTPDNDIGSAGTGRQIFFKASCGPTNKCAPGANALGYGSVHVTQGLQNEFESGDPRRAATIYLPGDDYFGTPFSSEWSVTGSTPAKYVKQDKNNSFDTSPFNRSINNERIIRYADVLLMLAEAKLLGNNDVNGAAQLINEVRRRADPTRVILPDVPASLTAAEMFSRLQHERRVELALEGHRYNDLVRWHRAGLIDIKRDVDFGRGPANKNWTPANLLKPIPQRELDLNSNLAQNEGYQ